MGLLPMEVLQSAFWSLDPTGVVSKFARFARLDPTSPTAHDFVALEQWANTGEPLPWSAATELAGNLFGSNQPANGQWHIGGCPVPAICPTPTLHLVAGRDRITPATTAPLGEQWLIPTGHVGLAIGTAARAQYHPALFGWLSAP
jgi:polyhydroxyalkanoate synthase